MKVSVFYQTFFERPNLLKKYFLAFFFVLSSWPRLVMEVFLRRRMGERYFSLGSVVLVFLLLRYFPKTVRYDEQQTFGPFALWDAFLFVFLVLGLYHKWQLRRRPQSFDFEHFSLSTGLLWPQLQSVTVWGKRIVFSPLVVETLVEPAVFFLPGALLWWGLHQYLGILWMGCAVFYSLSYVASYEQGKDFLLNQIDQKICEQDMGSTLSAGLAPDFSRGVYFPGELPTDPEQRRQMASAFVDDERAYPVR